MAPPTLEAVYGAHQSGGALCLVLHAHLPYVRHPEHPSFMEEDWLYEAITETYLPLLRMMDRLEADAVPWALTMSLTPPLCEMLVDPLLKDRYSERLDALVAIAVEESERKADSPFADAARFYVEELHELRARYHDRYGRDLVGAFRRHQDAGNLTILTCGATHGYLPLTCSDEARRAQLFVARDNYRKHFGRDPDGIWLPECAYAPGLDRHLADAGLRFCFVETHGVAYGSPRPRFGHLRPIVTPHGVMAFGRDPTCSKRVWSAEEGYPGDGSYREFYRDLGWDAEPDQVERVLGDGPRRGIGLKYHRVTGKVSLDDKQPYVPAWAQERAALHGKDFVDHVTAELARGRDAIGAAPLLVAPYDAELFGHWWFEGPWFLESFLREAASRALTGSRSLRLVTPRTWLAEQHPTQVVEPAGSSWGDEGTYKVWLNGGNAWMYPHLHRAEEHMIALAGRFDAPSPVEARALRQAARELVLAQASDWAFIVTMDTVVPYADKRTRDHLHRFHGLYLQLMEGRIEEAWLRELEAKDTIFQEIDWTHWKPIDAATGEGAAVSSAAP